MVMAVHKPQLIAVRPDNVHLLIYLGGYGGEFIGYWLSQHPGCVPAIAESLPKNRYVHRFTQKFVISTALATTSDDHVFFLSHPDGKPKDATTFNGIAINQIQDHSFIWCSHAYKKFFFLLQWIKMRLYKFNMMDIDTLGKWPSHIMNQFDQHHTLADFRKYINNRSWFYQFELNSFRAGQTLSAVLDQADIEYHYYHLMDQCDHLPRINLDQLMFGNTAQEHQRICEHFKLDYELAQPLTQSIQAYHQRNIEVAEKYLHMSVAQLLDLSDGKAWPVVEQALLRRHAEFLGFE
jgi:hypothetical protein